MNATVKALRVSFPETPSESAAAYEGYQSLVTRAGVVFGDEIIASRWLSMPSADLEGKVPLQVAQSVHYDASELKAIFEPLFIRIEHGIDF